MAGLIPQLSMPVGVEAGSKQARSSVQSSGSAMAPSGPSGRIVFRHQYCAVEEEREMSRSV